METNTLINIEIFCQQHKLDSQLISSLHEFGLIAIQFEDEKAYIAGEELAVLEKIICFHNELEINKEGIEVILRLLEEMKASQNEINNLRNQLRLYDSDI